MAEPPYRIEKPIMGQNRPVVRDGRSGSQNDDTQRKSLQTAQDSRSTQGLHHSPLGELIFGNLGITPEQLTSMGVPAWGGADDPIEWLESLANNVPLGEYFVPTTQRDLVGDAVLALLTGGMGNQALTGRAVSRPFRGRPAAIGELTLGPRVSDKLAELIPGPTASRLIDPTNPNLSARIAQTIFPNRPISGPRIISEKEIVSRRKPGVVERSRLPEQELGWHPKDIEPAAYRSIKGADEVIPESVGTLKSGLDVAKAQARKLRGPGASSLQRRAGRQHLEDIATEKSLLKESTPTRRRGQQQFELPSGMPLSPHRDHWRPTHIRNYTDDDLAFLRSLRIRE